MGTICGEGGTPEPEGGPEALVVLEIARALQTEFGVGIDAHPGGEGNEAGAVNRAFRAVVSVINGGITRPGDDPAAVLTWALRQVASRRLAELGVSPGRAEGLLVSEPDLGDLWFAYLTLAPDSVIQDL
jgi:hypothetical protein